MKNDKDADKNTISVYNGRMENEKERFADRSEMTGVNKTKKRTEYTAEDAARCLEIFKEVQYDEIIEITPEIHVRFNDAGHMLGSSIIELWVKEDGKETKTVFTGDIGNNDIPLLSEPTMIEETDYLVMESTYGNRLHMKNENT